MKNIILFLIFTLAPVLASARGELLDTHNAVVRIFNSAGSGTGIVFRETEDEYHVLTAGHVTHGEPTFNMFCYWDGEEYQVKGKLLWWEEEPCLGVTKFDFVKDGITFDRYDDATHKTWSKVVVKFDEVQDLAVIAFPKKGLKSVPTIIPLAKRGSVLKAGDPIYTIGCPQGNWPSGTMGRVTGMNSLISFKPNILPGRSGSGLLDKKGKEIHGIVIWSGSYGSTAIDLEGIYKALDRHEGKHGIQIVAGKSDSKADGD
jgi:S1-C subfamily serine protease